MFTADQLRKIVEEAKPENVVMIPNYNNTGENKTYIYKGVVRLTLSGSEYDGQDPTTYVSFDVMMWYGTQENTSKVTYLYEIKGVSYYNELYDILKKKDNIRLKNVKEFIKDIFGV